MNLRRCSVTLIVIGTFLPGNAIAAGDSFVTGNRLFGYCREQADSCTMYIAGITDALMMLSLTTKMRLVCPPNSVELGQVVDIVMNYLQAHPEKRQVSAASMATVALMKAFPCDAENK